VRVNFDVAQQIQKHCLTYIYFYLRHCMCFPALKNTARTHSSCHNHRNCTDNSNTVLGNMGKAAKAYCRLLTVLCFKYVWFSKSIHVFCSSGWFLRTKTYCKVFKKCCCQSKRDPWTFWSLPIFLGLEGSRDLYPRKEHIKVTEFNTETHTQKESTINPNLQAVPDFPEAS